VETSKNYPLPALGTVLCGGLDRHIEHHLWPDLPPHRLRALSARVRALCAAHGVRYVEHRSALASYLDSFRYLWRLSWPGPRGRPDEGRSPSNSPAEDLAARTRPGLQPGPPSREQAG